MTAVTWLAVVTEFRAIVLINLEKVSGNSCFEGKESRINNGKNSSYFLNKRLKNFSRNVRLFERIVVKI